MSAAPEQPSNGRPLGQVQFSSDGGPPPPPPERYLYVYRRPEIRGVHYSHEHVKLDGHTYIDCAFEQCTVDASAFNYDLIGCRVDQATILAYTASVANIIQLFGAYFPWANRHLPAFFVPVQEPGGTLLVWFIGREH